MPKAARVHSTPRRTASSSRTSPVDPIFRAIENHKRLDKAWLDLCPVLEQAECEAAKKHGYRPLPLVSWRDYRIGESEIERVRDELLRLSGIDPKTIESEYWDAKARLMGTELAAEQWDERAGLTALRRDEDRAGSAVERAAWKLAKTKPTTPAGASAMLTYISTEPAVGLFNLGETDWHETAFRTAVASLAKITGQSQRSA